RGRVKLRLRDDHPRQDALDDAAAWAHGTFTVVRTWPWASSARSVSGVVAVPATGSSCVSKPTRRCVASTAPEPDTSSQRATSVAPFQLTDTAIASVPVA